MLTILKEGFSSYYYEFVKPIQDYFQGAKALLATADPVWILGEKYEDAANLEGQLLSDEVMKKILSDFVSRVWMTYRKGFPPLGPVGCTSDAGWGCTLRSGQMLLAQVLLLHLKGRQWRRSSLVQEEVAQILQWFWDDPAPEHPFSLHNLVEAGKQHGVRVGEWLGPWTLCHTLQEVVNRAHSAGLHVHVHVANTPGGGAPLLYTASINDIFAGDVKTESSRVSIVSRGVLLLIPLRLGSGSKINPTYVPQLQAVLQWPQSAGIVGGRPSSSLYFIGYQASQIIFLDPHKVQEMGSTPADVAETYFCSTPRTMLIDSIDPSLAIAFYCRSQASFENLTSRLKALEKEAGHAPLLNIAEGSSPPPLTEDELYLSLDEDGEHGDEDWEELAAPRSRASSCQL